MLSNFVFINSQSNKATLPYLYGTLKEKYWNRQQMFGFVAFYNYQKCLYHFVDAKVVAEQIFKFQDKLSRVWEPWKSQAPLRLNFKFKFACCILIIC